MNRIEQFFRDPTLDQPSTDEFFVVRTVWDRFVVNREVAARILSTVGASVAPSIIRCETVSGSVVYVRPDTIVYVRESTRAQREADRRFWKDIDDEEKENEDDEPYGS